jgi:membrane-bound ClpP family serine protease
MIATIGVLLLLAGVSTFVIGLARYFFPSTEKLMPESFKKIMIMRYAVYCFLLGLILLRFFGV